ncbi:hypothetical protein [Hymenobacter antarcticus]|uniref:Uncharacterized protein n=1 Tax=Hymenobacter antarcticus TaxID=486270 RepID=A0ABP7PMU2_9BACT
MRQINILIASLYVRSRVTMIYSGNSAVLFIAKATFCVVLWIYLLTVVSVYIGISGKYELMVDIPNSRIYYVLVLAIIYLPVNLLTWKIDEVEFFVSDDENQNIIQRGQRTFIILLVIGFILMVIAAKYKNGTLF